MGETSRLHAQASGQNVVDVSLKVADQTGLEGVDLGDDAVIAQVVLRPWRDRRERPQLKAELPAQIAQPVEARDRSVQMPRAVVQMQAGPTSEFIEIDVLAPPAAPRALEPGQVPNRSTPPLTARTARTLSRGISRSCGG